jgi:hypothetical protein
MKRTSALMERDDAYPSGPARRLGQTTQIYDHPLTDDALTLNRDGGITVTLDANCQKSLYRYRIHLTASEKAKLASALVQI